MPRIMTMNQPGFRVFALISVGFALKFLSRQLELSGDLSAAAGARLGYHLTALVILIAAFVCFAWAFKMIFFDKPGTPRNDKPLPPTKPDAVDVSPETFDPDAAIARYMSRREGPASGEAPVAKPGSFGRKRV